MRWLHHLKRSMNATVRAFAPTWTCRPPTSIQQFVRCPQTSTISALANREGWGQAPASPLALLSGTANEAGARGWRRS